MNFDGAAKGNPGRASICGIIRDPFGKMVVGFVGGIGVQSALVAEARALFMGLKIVVSLGIVNLHIEGDSKVVTDAVKKEKFIGWNTKDILIDVSFLMSKLRNKKVSHIYREGNCVADALANLGSGWALARCWKRIERLPSNIQILIGRERSSMVNNDL